MCMANIWIEGHGVFTVSNEKVSDLIGWLSANQAVQAEGTSEEFNGQQLLNEQVPPQQPKGGQVKSPDSAHAPREKTDPNKTWDHGTTWI